MLCVALRTISPDGLSAAPHRVVVQHWHVAGGWCRTNQPAQQAVSSPVPVALVVSDAGGDISKNFTQVM